MKLPAIQFYPGDWRKDPGVQALNFHDRGVWFEILCLMHESEERGILLLGGKPMPEEALARTLGLDKQILTTTLTTILSYGVAGRDEATGALICRRMIRDEKIRKVRAEAGKMGGNPKLLKQNTTTKVNQIQTTGDNQIPTPSSSSSSSDTPLPPASPSAREAKAPTSAEAIAVADLFGRRHSTEWHEKEIAAFKKLIARGVLTTESLKTVSDYYRCERAKGSDGIHRRDLKTFLNNFDGELDRAESFKLHCKNGFSHKEDDRPAAFKVPMNPPPQRPAGI